MLFVFFFNVLLIMSYKNVNVSNTAKASLAVHRFLLTRLCMFHDLLTPYKVSMTFDQVPD